ncbi:hypothetical protein SNEBB_002900 [Seison nebaliae]|nr:hypothetical protein SNEBB_002900 [Seison nebaliae]
MATAEEKLEIISEKMKKTVRFGEDVKPTSVDDDKNGGLDDQAQLPPQKSLDEIGVENLTPLTEDVITHQATINIGTIGHVAHGKSTIVKALTGIYPIRFKKEKLKNITIKLGYANCKIYKCSNKECPRPGCFQCLPSSAPNDVDCPRVGCESKMKVVRHVSFVDCPGHDILMATMLNGAAVMDAALLIIAGNEPCPQPQTSEHLAAVEIMNLRNIIIVQNKIDLIAEEQAREQSEHITKFIEGTVADGAPILPISAQLQYNIEVLCEYIYRKVPIPRRQFDVPARLIVIRSFDINKPGCTAENLQGGVAGGSLLQGVLRIGQEIELRPGITERNANNETICRPLFSRIVSLHTEENALSFAVPGGLIGVGTQLEPALCRGDKIVGQMLGSVGTLPKIYNEIEVAYYLVRRLFGAKKNADKKATKVERLKEKEDLILNIGSLSTGGRVIGLINDLAKIQLLAPVCTEIGEKVAISRTIDDTCRLIGWGRIVQGLAVEPVLSYHK